MAPLFICSKSTKSYISSLGGLMFHFIFLLAACKRVWFVLDHAALSQLINHSLFWFIRVKTLFVLRLKQWLLKIQLYLCLGVTNITINFKSRVKITSLKVPYWFTEWRSTCMCSVSQKQLADILETDFIKEINKNIKG